MKCWQLLLPGLVILPIGLFAQNEDPHPGTTTAVRPVDPVVIRAEQMAGDGKLTNAETFEAQLAAPRLGAIELPPVGTRPLKGREIAERARLVAREQRVGGTRRVRQCDRARGADPIDLTGLAGSSPSGESRAAGGGESDLYESPRGDSGEGGAVAPWARGSGIVSRRVGGGALTMEDGIPEGNCPNISGRCC